VRAIDVSELIMRTGVVNLPLVVDVDGTERRVSGVLVRSKMVGDVSVPNRVVLVVELSE
jgi:hypothetical protein